MHGSTLGTLIRRTDAEAVAADRIDAVADPRVRALASWARGTGAFTGSAHQSPELLGVAFTFQYLNRMVNVFLGESPLPPEVPWPLRRYALGFLGRRLRPPDGRYVTPGRALDLLPKVDLPPRLSWATANPTVAQALARAYEAIESAGRRRLSPAVREVVVTTLAAWTGQPPGISRDWVEPAVQGLPPTDRPAARLALLTAMASYQVDRSVVEAFRHVSPDDESLVELTSWASLAAAMRTVESIVVVRANGEDHGIAGDR